MVVAGLLIGVVLAAVLLVFSWSGPPDGFGGW